MSNLSWISSWNVCAMWLLGAMCEIAAASTRSLALDDGGGHWLAAIQGAWNGVWGEHSQAATGRPDWSALKHQTDIWWTWCLSFFKLSPLPLFLSFLVSPPPTNCLPMTWAPAEQSVILPRGKDIKGGTPRLKGTTRLRANTWPTGAKTGRRSSKATLPSDGFAQHNGAHIYRTMWIFCMLKIRNHF